MSKTKTKKSLKKRFRVTKTGKVLRGKSFSGHLKAKKSKKRRNQLKKQTKLKDPFAKKVKKYMGVTKPKKGKDGKSKDK
jgi:large subunit ribosomal protein L35